MADVRRGQGSAIARALALLPALLFAGFANSAAMAQLSEQPVLVVDPGMHTGAIKSVGGDAAGRFAVTGSYDKTVRVWSIPDGKLLQTIRMPVGPGSVGRADTVAMSPDGDVVAVGGWTRWTAEKPGESIYLFEWRTGKMAARIDGVSDLTFSLAFSPDGRYLAAGLGERSGLRIYDRDRQWTEVFRDTDYGGEVYGLAFARDGRLATTSWDGNVRLYDSHFKLLVPPRKVASQRPTRIAFSPDETTLAVGIDDAVEVALFDGHSLTPLPGPNLNGLRNGGGLAQVAWSKDGNTLYAGGWYFLNIGGLVSRPVLAWAAAGRGERRTLPAGQNTVGGLIALPDSGLFVAAMDPMVELLGPDGEPRWAHHSPKAVSINQDGHLAVSADGTIVDFGFEQFGKSPMRFDVRSLKLSQDPPSDQRTNRPTQTGLAIASWRSPSPTLNGEAIKIAPWEESHSLAIHPQGDRFVLGEDFALEAFDAKGRRLWHRNTGANGMTSAVNITADGRLVVARFSDGTIRWHRMDDGRELLTLYVLDKQNWVAWTPEGFYAATPGAYGVLRWQVNHGFDAAADTVPVSEIPGLQRPDALALVLQELETARALGIADLTAARIKVQSVTGAAVPPGVRLHVLTIGVSDYGDKANDLKLKFADRDAQDVANALIKQEGGLYAKVLVDYLANERANRAGIFKELAVMQNNMAQDDIAVVMFSGHGAMVDGQFYLVPYGVDDSSDADLKASAIAATEFGNEIAKVAEHGRVLVLLDACHSGGLLEMESTRARSPLRAADKLRDAIVSGNVTVLTSSKADQLSREDEKWGEHGAFTKALLDGLSGTATDTNHRMITMGELTEYIAAHLGKLTEGNQQLGFTGSIVGGLFVVGL